MISKAARVTLDGEPIIIDSTRLEDHADCMYLRLYRREVNDVMYRAWYEDGVLKVNWEAASEETDDIEDERPYCGSCGVMLDVPETEDWMEDVS